MALHSSWKGYLKISLVSIPLKAYTASSSSTRPITLNQLHAECKSRIQYKKSCPIHGEVPNDEIVSGYEFAKGQYAIIDTDEIEKLRTEGDKSINLATFVPDDTVDPLYLSGQTYYLVPDGPVGQKPYALVQNCLREGRLNGIGTVLISGKEKLVRLRAADRLLAMDVLQYETQVKKPESFTDELVDTGSTPEEVKLTESLVEAMTTDAFDPTAYKDEYTEKLTQLIEAKVEGKELVSPAASQQPQIINLMEALKESVKRVAVPGKARVTKPQTKAEPKPKAAAKPGKKMAPSASTRAKKTTTTRKKKSG